MFTLNENQAWEAVLERFPFEGYIPVARKHAYVEMPRAIKRYLPVGSEILDFGAGSCDKTAMMSLQGFNVTAFDDWGDDWYTFGDNESKILTFAEQCAINYIKKFEQIAEKKYDAIVLNNVVEHLHDSPRVLLNELLRSLKSGGYLFIAVPNAANFRKRIAIMLGKTNYPSYESFFWSADPWRGHVREYVESDLIKLAKFLNLEEKQVYSHHYHLDQVSEPYRSAFVGLCKIFPGWRETWMLVAKKNAGWTEKLQPSFDEAKVALKKHYFKYKEEDLKWK